ncbi:MAG: cytidine deaminase [FCB group bacterium]|nr:cytidine deaminase [FCB group bacterium]
MKSEELIEYARTARKRAKAPYSNYKVGAALLTKDGTVVLGCNIESKAYPSTMCAERVAIFSAMAQGYNEFQSMALITEDGGTPCGACRQVMLENLGNIPVYIADLNGDYKILTVEELLPHPFQ